MPIVGTGTSPVTRAASAAGIFSSTMPKHPARLSRWASRTSFLGFGLLAGPHGVGAELVDRLGREPEVSP